MSRFTDWCHIGLQFAATTSVALLMAATTTSVAAASPQPAEAPVEVITAPVVDAHFGSSGLDGSVTVEERRKGTASRLDSSVLFSRDSARLRPGARGRIAALARQLRDGGPGKITVTGYTDDLGSAAHGLQLSKRRAAAVAGALSRNLGGGWPKITAIGRGEADPAVPNTSEKNRKLNRRVVIIVER